MESRSVRLFVCGALGFTDPRRTSLIRAFRAKLRSADVILCGHPELEVVMAVYGSNANEPVSAQLGRGGSRILLRGAAAEF